MVIQPKIFFILLNWNNWNETRECLESLQRVKYPNFQILVVDNGSSQATKAEVRKYQISNIRYQVLWNVENSGFAGGNNVGITYALEHGADYIMVLNNDTVVAPDFLRELVKVAENDPSFGITGSRIYKYGTDEIVFDGGRINAWLTKGEHYLGFRVQDLGFNEVGYITGAAMLIKREVIEKVGLMREEYFLYYEDVDLCIRARKTGYKCVLVPTSKVWHKVSATNKEGSPSYIYYHTRNSLMLAKWNGNIFQKFAAYTFGTWVLLKQAIKFVFSPSKRVWAKAMTRGVLDFCFTRYGKYK